MEGLESHKLEKRGLIVHFSQLKANASLKSYRLIIDIMIVFWKSTSLDVQQRSLSASPGRSTSREEKELTWSVIYQKKVTGADTSQSVESFKLERLLLHKAKHVVKDEENHL